MLRAASWVAGSMSDVVEQGPDETLESHTRCAGRDHERAHSRQPSSGIPVTRGAVAVRRSHLGMLHPRRFLYCAAAHRRPKRPPSSRRFFGQAYLGRASRCPGVQTGGIVALPDVSPLGTDTNPTPADDLFHHRRLRRPARGVGRHVGVTSSLLPVRSSTCRPERLALGLLAVIGVATVLANGVRRDRPIGRSVAAGRTDLPVSTTFRWSVGRVPCDLRHDEIPGLRRRVLVTVSR